MIQETFSGVELLALYGEEDDRIGLDDELLGGRFRRGIRRLGRGLKRAARYTPHYQALRAAKWGVKKARRRLRGEDDERVGQEAELLGWSLRRGLKRAARLTPHYWAYKGARKAGRGIRRAFRFRGEDGAEYMIDGDDGGVYMYGEDQELIFLGEVENLEGFKKFFKKVGRGVRKVGKVTSGFTTGIARAVGVPQSVIDAASKLDPTRRGTTVKGAVRAVTPQPVAQPKRIAIVKSSAMKLDAKNFAIMAGAGAAGIILVKVLSGRRSRAEA